jgi:hypothetical protein
MERRPRDAAAHELRVEARPNPHGHLGRGRVERRDVEGARACHVDGNDEAPVPPHAAAADEGLPAEEANARVLRHRRDVADEIDLVEVGRRVRRFQRQRRRACACATWPREQHDEHEERAAHCGQA